MPRDLHSLIPLGANKSRQLRRAAVALLLGVLALGLIAGTASARLGSKSAGATTTEATTTTAEDTSTTETTTTEPAGRHHDDHRRGHDDRSDDNDRGRRRRCGGRRSRRRAVATGVEHPVGLDRLRDPGRGRGHLRDRLADPAASPRLIELRLRSHARYVVFVTRRPRRRDRLGLPGDLPAGGVLLTEEMLTSRRSRL